MARYAFYLNNLKISKMSKMKKYLFQDGWKGEKAKKKGVGLFKCF